MAKQDQTLIDNQKKGIITALVGYERCDVAFLLSELFNLVKKNTLVIDNSISHDLYNTVSLDDEVGFIDRGKVSFAKDIAYSEDAFLMFDHIIIYEGFNPQTETLRNSNTIYLFTDYTKACIDRVSGIIATMDEEMKKKSLIVARDRLSGKHSDKNIARLLNIPLEQMLCGISFSKTDSLRYENFTYDQKLATRGCSPELKDLLTYMFARALSLNEKTARKILKKL